MSVPLAAVSLHHRLLPAGSHALLGVVGLNRFPMMSAKEHPHASKSQDNSRRPFKIHFEYSLGSEITTSDADYLQQQLLPTTNAVLRQFIQVCVLHRVNRRNHQTLQVHPGSSSRMAMPLCSCFCMSGSCRQIFFCDQFRMFACVNPMSNIRYLEQ